MPPSFIEIPRVGRPANPAERGLQLAIEDAAILEAMAENLFLEESAHYDVEALDRWRTLTDPEREPWRTRALALVRAHARRWHPPPDPDDPDPGASVPNVSGRTEVSTKVA